MSAKNPQKLRVKITLPADLVLEARNYGINISRVSENALREVLLKLKQGINSDPKENLSEREEMRRPGFEPGSSAWKTLGNGFNPDTNKAHNSKPTLRIYPETIEAYEEWAFLHLGLKERTVKGHVTVLNKLLAFTRGRITPEKVAQFYARYRDAPAGTLHNVGKALRRFFRDYLQREDLLSMVRFRWPTPPPRFKEYPSTEAIRAGFAALKTDVERALYLFTATTGLRWGEVLSLTPDKIRWGHRAVIPEMYRASKRTGITFYNEETEAWLLHYLPHRSEGDERLFQISAKASRKMWYRASKVAGEKISPQRLRIWFGMELRKRGVPDSFVNIFHGRAPRSVLEQYYTPAGLEELKEVYDRASLRIGVPLPEQESTEHLP